MRYSTFESVRAGLPIRGKVAYEELGADNTPKSGFGVVYDERGSRVAVLREHVTAKGMRVGTKAVSFLGECGIAAASHFPFVGPRNTELLLVQYLDGPTLDAAPSVSKEAMYAHAMRLGGYFIRAYTESELVMNDVIAPYQYVVHDGEPTLIDLALYVKSNPLTASDLGYYLEDVAHEYRPFLRGSGHDLSADLAQAYQECLPTV